MQIKREEKIIYEGHQYKASAITYNFLSPGD